MPRLIEFPHGDHVISTDPTRVDVRAVHRWIAEESYWAPGRAFDVQQRAIEQSALVIGAYDATGAQAGFARMVTDLATFGWLADVYVVATARGAGLGTVMVRTIVEHPDVASVSRQVLATRDAHQLYRSFGYEQMAEPERWMMRHGSP